MNNQISDRSIIVHLHPVWWVRFAIPLLLFLIAACIESQASTLSSPFPSSTPEEQGMDSKQLLNMLDDIDRANINLHSILVVRNGATVLEAYFPPYGPQDRHLLFSVTKSVTSALVGIAVKEGKIKSVDDPFLSYFKDAAVANRSAWKEKITIKDLLNMTSGIEMCDDYMGSRPNEIQYSLDQPVRFEPGTSFNYNPCNSILLSGIIQKTTGKTALAYAQEKLFDPLGIRDVYWDPAQGGITQGNTGLMLTPREMAKFGTLYLQNGKWQGVQILPSEWVKESLNPEAGYAYQWKTNEDAAFTYGYGEQAIYILPAKNLILVTTGGSPIYMDLGSELIYSYLLPAIQSDQPLPADPAAQALADRVVAIANPPDKPLSTLLPVTTTFSGKTIRLEENPLGWKTARLEFEGSRAWLTITTSTIPEEQKFEIGLDGLYRKTDVKKVEKRNFPQLNQRHDLNPFRFNFVVGVPLDGQVAMKGEWCEENKFMLTVQDMRDFNLDRVSFEFTPPGVKIGWISLLDRSFDLYLSGRLE